MINKRSGRQFKQQGGKIRYVTLPYDFIPFAANAYFPYTQDKVNKHDELSGLSGWITYTITPYSDIVMEVREKQGGGYFVSGSQIRGRIRANLEMLSASYPEFVSRKVMVYRDFSGISRRSYQERMGLEAGAGVERAVCAGFLRKEGQEFYIVPAQTLGDKNFLSIKEHRLLNLGVQANKSISLLFNWTYARKAEMNNIQKAIEDKTRQIILLRQKVKTKLRINQGKISQIFLLKEYNFTTAFDKNKKLEVLKEELWQKIKALISSSDPEVERLYQLTVDRWYLKAQMYLRYRQMAYHEKNKRFEPYQKSIYYQLTAGGGIDKLAFSSSADIPHKGYLFNSTNAGSKRSHYFVLPPQKDRQRVWVSQSLIDAYEQNLEKFHSSKFKMFYNIFENYDELSRGPGSADGIIVFFKTESDSEKLSCIGRTPYFKIPYHHQLEQLLGQRPPGKIDFASALFGYIPAERSGDSAYKSRLRFSPVDIEGEFTCEKKKLLLATPYASAQAMYLQQQGTDLQTYEQKTAPKLNGYKYYHVLPQPHNAQAGNRFDAMLSEKRIIHSRNITLSGRIYFHNLTKAELGLLLVSIETEQFLQSKRYQDIVANYKESLQQTYELIGGAKPYGYGKVKIHIQSLNFEKAGNDFDTLILNPTQIVDHWDEYIDAFIEEMDGKNYFSEINFASYVVSKQEFFSPIDIYWDSDKLKNGGYDKSYRLKQKGPGRRLVHKLENPVD